MADEPASQGLIDTSVLIDLENVAPDTLPTEMSIAAVTLAELAAGPHATEDATERARRHLAVAVKVDGETCWAPQSENHSRPSCQRGCLPNTTPAMRIRGTPEAIASVILPGLSR